MCAIECVIDVTVCSGHKL